jgi:hypothetical protein
VKMLGQTWQLSLLPALGIALLSADVNAGASTASGTLCRPAVGTSVAYGTVGVQNVGGIMGNVSCAVPMDDVALGSSVNFRVSVYDNSSTDSVSCAPYVVNEQGTTVATAAAKVTGVGATGAFTLTGTLGAPWPGAVAGNVNTNMYAIQCQLPPGSVIYTVRAQ